MTKSRAVSEFDWAPSAAKHGISRARARHVIETASVVLPHPEEDGEPDPALLFYLGEDPNGILLEVLLRLVEDGVPRVFHVMKIRPEYRALYEQLSR